MTRLSKIIVLASLLCSGCAIGQNTRGLWQRRRWRSKKMAGNDQWKMATPSDDLLKGKWWEIFGDPQLNRLEELVNVNNQNVKQAEAQFRQARALVAANHAITIPPSERLRRSRKATPERNTGRGNGTSVSYSLPATATWEPDLWGRVRLSVENAVNNAQVSAADLENIKLSQQALLATDYFLLAAQDMQIKVLSDTITAYDKNLQLTINRYNGGVASKSDITLAQTQLAGAKAQSTDMRITRAQDEHAIAMLTGQRRPRSRSAPPQSAVPLRPFRWLFPRNFWSGVPISRRMSGRWPPQRERGNCRDRLLSHVDSFGKPRPACY